MSGEADSAASKPRRRRGPNTPGGKWRSSRNALRHGLSLTLAGEAVERAEQLAVGIAGNEPSAERMEQSRAFAHAEIDLWRVHAARAAMIDLAMPQLVRLERYERRAHSRRKRAARKLDSMT